MSVCDAPPPPPPPRGELGGGRGAPRVVDVYILNEIIAPLPTYVPIPILFHDRCIPLDIMRENVNQASSEAVGVCRSSTRTGQE